QQRPDTLWAGTGESNMRNSVSIGNGIYRSTDAGESWQLKGLEKSEHISRIVLHPKNPKILFAAVPGALWSDSEDRGLYKSEDGGETWTKSLYINAKTGCAEVLIDPNNPDIMYASTWEFRRTPYAFQSGGPGSALYKSKDGGVTWNKLTNGLPAPPFGRIAMTLAPTAPDNLFAIVETNNTALYISSDQGEHWKQQSSTNNVCARPFYFSTLVVDPKDPKRVYRPSYSLSISSDGAYSFIEPGYGSGGVHSDHHALWIDPNNTSHMYLGTDGGVYESKDKGNNFTFLTNLPVSQFYHVAIDQQEPYNIYGGLQDNGSWQGPSSKSGGIKNGDWLELFGGDGFWVIPDLNETDIVYAEYQGGNMARVNKRTHESQSIKPFQIAGEEKLRFNWNTPIVPSPTNPKRLYAGSQYLYLSHNQGRDWTKISKDLTTNDKKKQEQESSGGLTVDNSSAENHCTIFTIAESVLDSNTIYVGTDDGKLQKTSDQGKTWQDLAYAGAGIPAGTWVSSIEPSRYDKNVVYATFDNHSYGDHNTYLAVSRDGGLKWERIHNSDFTGYAHKIREDLKQKTLLFLGTEMGLFISTDGGKNWARYKSSFPEYACVRDLAIHPKTNDLIVATHGRGIYIVDDISTLRQLTPEIMGSNVVVMESRPVVVKSTGQMTNGFGQAGEFVGSNYTEDACITYYLKDRVNSGDVKVEIYDNTGKFLYDLPGTKRKGVNKVFWNMRMKPPKASNTGAGFDMGALMSPLVDPGEYRIKLRVDTMVYEGKLVLLEDPKSQHSAEDKAIQRKTAKELMGMVSQLNFSAQNIVKVKEGLNANIPKIKNSKDQKVLSTYENELEVIRKKMLATKESKGITGEEQLREKLSALYGGVCSYDGRPSGYQL
ncbi:MAG: glycosyl hydrolase, partial [Saprospiraceae bacterium]